MKNKHSKYAFFSIDVERFIDTECVYKSKQKVNSTMLDGLDEYMKILDKYGVKATMFVLSDIAEDIQEQLKRYLKNGHRIAIHGKAHIAPKLMTDEQFKSQLTSAKEKLENMFDTRILGYRAPCFGINQKKFELLKDMEFMYDSSRMDFSGARYHSNVDMQGYDNPIGEMYVKNGFCEFGLPTERVFGQNFPVSGGGYLRLANWFFARHMIKRYIKHSDYYMFYAHPFEFSKEKIPKIKKLKLYDRMYLNFGHFSYPLKIEYIIKLLKKNGYIFTTVEDFMENNLKKIEFCAK